MGSSFSKMLSVFLLFVYNFLIVRNVSRIGHKSLYPTSGKKLEFASAFLSDREDVLRLGDVPTDSQISLRQDRDMIAASQLFF
jgi:hypothetical protein